jgi:hypothetical protein
MTFLLLNRPRRLGALTAAAALVALSSSAGSAQAADAFPPTPGVPCDAGSLPESTQGRVPLSEVTSGRAAKGYTCNARELGQFGKTGGYRVESYVDKAGRICGYYDTTLLFPKDAVTAGSDGTGTYVMDMTDPTKPKYIRTLSTPAMQSPHESLRLNQKRGLLAAVFGSPATNVGIIDVYDVTADCRNPVLKSSTPLGVLGHESGFAPDGNTFYAGSLDAQTITAVDVADPVVPKVLWLTRLYKAHGMSVSDDGNRLYIAERSDAFKGLTILDVTQVQKRVLNPTVPMVSRLTWPNVGTPQYAEPFTSKGHKYLMEIDEFGSKANVGAGRIIDLEDEKKPFVVSQLRLAVNQEAAQTGEQTKDPGASTAFQGYRGHYCSIPTRIDPTRVACTFIVSGLRVFDIADPTKPQEIAYFNAKIPAGDPGSFAMAAPAFSPRKDEIWYSDGNHGFYAVKLTAGAKRTGPTAAGPTAAGPKQAPARPAAPSSAGGQLPTTGLPVLLPLTAAACLGGFVWMRRRRHV